jgi:hypothetical protein
MSCFLSDLPVITSSAIYDLSEFKHKENYVGNVLS